MNKIVKGILVAFLALFVINIAWIGWKTYQKHKGTDNAASPEEIVIISSQTGGDTKTFEPDEKLPVSVIGNEYTIHFVFDIQDNNNKDIIILAQKGDDSNFNPRIKLDTKKKDLEVLFTLQNESYDKLNSVFNENKDECENTEDTQTTPADDTTPIEQTIEQTSNKNGSSQDPSLDTLQPANTPKDGFTNIGGIQQLYNQDLFKNISNEMFYKTTQSEPEGASSPEVSKTDEQTALENNEQNISENHIKHNHEHSHSNNHNHTDDNNNDNDNNAIIIDSCKYLGTGQDRLLGHNRPHHFTVSVYNNIVDIYKDGQLNSSCTLKGIPTPNTDMFRFFLNGEFKGNIYKFVYVNKAFNQEQAASLYNRHRV
jgi:hypothetical protein